MKTKLRLISTILILSMIFPICSGIIQPVFAADSPLNIYIDQNSYNQSDRTLKLRWDAVLNAQTCSIKYHVPGSTVPLEVPESQIDLVKSTATVTNIKNDIIYDFEISVTDIYGDSYTGKQYFLPQISVFAEQVDQQYVSVVGGGYQTGIYPAIKLSWNIPQVYSAKSNAMEYANTNINGSTPLQEIDANINKMNFTFHLLSKSKDPKTGAISESLANVIVNMNPNATAASMYTASVSGDSSESKIESKIKWNPETGKYTFYILGLKDSLASIPNADEILQNRDDETGLETLPSVIAQANDNEYVLLHKEVRPGSIYVVRMDTLFYDDKNTYMDSVARGLTQSPLVGKTNYTYTPIRFQLSKDSLDLIYIRVFKVNAGDIQLPDLYYEIQTSDVPSKQDSSWTPRYNLKDDNFRGSNESAIAAFEGINPNNTVYYRIVVKSDAVEDRIQSLNLPYKMKEDTARPPVPKNITIAKIELERVPVAEDKKTSNVTITWDKPSNWDEIMNDPSKEIYFHFLLNINAKDMELNPKPLLTADGKEYGYHDVKYRLVRYVSSRSPNIKLTPDGSKLIYRLNGLELFKWEDESGVSHNITNDEDPAYPTYLLQNKTYYLQMYTTLAADKGETSDALKMSDKSLIESFTTLSPTGREVPTPNNIELVETTVVPDPIPSNATVKLRFDDLKIDWSNYTSNLEDKANAVVYDLYMSTSTDPKTFRQIGNTEEFEGDVKFEMQTLNNTTWVYATINKFTGENINRYGYSLTPNATYYFMIKVRLRMPDEDGNINWKESLGTVLLPVTTPRGEATTPDDTAKRPLAPTDFAIASDSNGNPMVSGQSVTFEWTVQENEAAYNLISTTNRVRTDARDDDPSIVEDSTYKSFISVFGNKDDNYDGNSQKLTLDPNSPQYPANFTYNSETKKCRYTINTWLYPNKIYYFTLRSEVVDATGYPKSSVWVSIPVTTSLIESPSMLQIVNNCELAFYWYDTLANMTAENYKILLKESGNPTYTQLSRSQYTIVKDGTIYYGRTTPLAKLKPNTKYNIKVVRIISSDPQTDKEISTYTMSTRNDYYQIDLKWQGYTIDPFSGFEIAIKTQDDSDYTVLTNAVDLEQYFDTTTQTNYPYYIEKSNSNVNTNFCTYNARIKMAQVTLSDGTKEHRALKPNTKYFIKVRAVKYDSTSMQAFTASKYIGPVDTRTEFSQDDYDDNDNATGVVSKFLDMIEKLESGTYWDISKKNGTVNKILVKDDKIINLLEGYGHFSCAIDMAQSLDYINSDEIYISKDILKAMKSNNKSIVIRSKDIEYTIRPETFNIDDMKEFEKAGDVDNSKDVYLQLNNTQSTTMIPSAPSNTTASSKINMLTAQAVTSMKTSAVVNEMIKNKIYNDTTGLVKKKVAIIQNPNNTNIKGDAKKVTKYLEQLYEDLKSELSYYLEDTLNGVGYTEGVLANKFSITKFTSPLGVKMPYKSDSIANPYVAYNDAKNWQKLTQNLKYENGYLNFFVTSTGKYTIFSSRNISDTIKSDITAKPYISKLAAKYDLTTVFPGSDKSFNPDLNVTVQEMILLYELVTENKNNGNTDIKVKAKEYGIDKIINTTNLYRNITRQEAAAIATKLYCQMTGADYNKLRVTYGKDIKDNSSITKKYAIPVYMCLKMNVMTLDTSGNFKPQETINRAQIAVVIQKILEA